MTALRYGISDTLVLAKRSLLRIPRQPDLLVGFTIQPIMFVLLFVYVFGGAIQTPGYDYVDFLMPGIIVQSIAFGGFVTALGLSDDLKKGLMDRFRSLPMTRSALLTGRTLGDVVTNVFQLVVMFAVGLRSASTSRAASRRSSPGSCCCLLIGYAFSWVFAFIGLSSSSPEASNAWGFTILFPAHVRLVRLRARRLDAELAPADRRAQPVHDHGRRRPRSVHRNAGGQRRLAGGGLDARDHRRLRPALRVALPARRRALRRAERATVVIRSCAGSPSAGLEARGLLRAARGVARAVGVRAGAGELAAVDDQVLLADRAAVEPALEDLARRRPRSAPARRGSCPEMCGVMPWWGIVRQGWSFGAGCGNQTSPA